MALCNCLAVNFKLLVLVLVQYCKIHFEIYYDLKGKVAPLHAMKA